MDEINTGGPAFPRPMAETSLGGNFEQDGMSLRDYFASLADRFPPDADINHVEGIVGRPFPEEQGPLAAVMWWAEADAKYAYIQADAMLAAREEVQKALAKARGEAA